MTSLEICAGAGGQAIGLERAGISPSMLMDVEGDACRTLRWNRRSWAVEQVDLNYFDPYHHEATRGVDLLSGGLPRVKSAATATRVETGEQWRLLRTAVRLARVMRPRAVLLENMPELIERPRFSDAREWLEKSLTSLGYVVTCGVLTASDFGVPQVRRQGFLVALRDDCEEQFHWPEPSGVAAPTLGEALSDSMASKDWPGAASWVARANAPAPTIVGGSSDRGGADLGPSGQKNAWARFGINGKSIGDDVPDANFPADGMPRLTVRQAALLQSFPETWTLVGKKTSTYRQVGHATPPPVAEAIGRALVRALEGEDASQDDTDT
ncbi:DNA cytosine methyltransferase [Streptomyces diacarni]|uniref:DNA (cytosine-5-)-methyltransferase n=1 Tax=Streptomyces diacarni TaxID=2800381 RepID=A0A367F0V3_9ACTN|nr:DNA cytosine methyltransferase [Streptomyces diacarni]RCG23579.1 DNA cytosine methyltransferase [Streptomyces diacarni]